jgi:hypothetical protein
MEDSSGPSWGNINEQARKCYRYSLAAALLDGLFEHPATIVTSAPYVRFYSRVMYNTEFFRSQLDTFQLFKRREASGFRETSQYPEQD